jgi:hypothetical protein
MKIAFEIYPPLKMTEDGNNINGLPYQNCIKTEPGKSKRRYSERFGSRKEGVCTSVPSPEPQIITYEKFIEFQILCIQKINQI